MRGLDSWSKEVAAFVFRSFVSDESQQSIIQILFLT